MHEALFCCTTVVNSGTGTVRFRTATFCCARSSSIKSSSISFRTFYCCFEPLHIIIILNTSATGTVLLGILGAAYSDYSTVTGRQTIQRRALCGQLSLTAQIENHLTKPFFL